MAEFYAGLALTAKRLLTTYGQTVTVTQSTGEVYDPATGLTTPGTNTSFTGVGAVFNYQSNRIDGVSIVTGDQKLLLESASEPQINAVITTADGTFNVMSVSPLSPAGIVVYYEVQLRS